MEESFEYLHCLINSHIHSPEQASFKDDVPYHNINFLTCKTYCATSGGPVYGFLNSPRYPPSSSSRENRLARQKSNTVSGGYPTMSGGYPTMSGGYPTISAGIALGLQKIACQISNTVLADVCLFYQNLSYKLLHLLATNPFCLERIKWTQIILLLNPSTHLYSTTVLLVIILYWQLHEKSDVWLFSFRSRPIPMLVRVITNVKLEFY